MNFLRDFFFKRCVVNEFDTRSPKSIQWYDNHFYETKHEYQMDSEGKSFFNLNFGNDLDDHEKKAEVVGLLENENIDIEFQNILNH